MLGMTPTRSARSAVKVTNAPQAWCFPTHRYPMALRASWNEWSQKLALAGSSEVHRKWVRMTHGRYLGQLMMSIHWRSTLIAFPWRGELGKSIKVKEIEAWSRCIENSVNRKKQVPMMQLGVINYEMMDTERNHLEILNQTKNAQSGAIPNKWIKKIIPRDAEYGTLAENTEIKN